MKTSHRTVFRFYGGIYCAKVVKAKIINAFIEEETRTVEEKAQAQEKKASSTSSR
jgi:hypothetical protein